MMLRWGARPRLRRAATALIALTLLPVAVMVGAAHGPSASPPVFAAVGLHAEDLQTPSVEALQRSQASNLFAPFAWDGQAATGPFVSFGFSPHSGTIYGFSSINGSATQVLIQSIEVQGFSGGGSPVLHGPIFRADGLGVTIIAHQEPMALLEIESAAGPRTVVFTFEAGTTALAISHAAAWPQTTLSFAVGDNHGSVILWKGTMSVNGTTVTAVLDSGDYLALRVVPAFADDHPERAAILDAFASGRLAAEYDLVAMTDGGWLENAAQYQPNMTLTSDGVGFAEATLTMTAASERGGIILLAFDPRTMPADGGHRLVVVNDGTEIAETGDPVATLRATAGATHAASFSLLSMNATVLAVYLPSVSSASIRVESVAVPPAGVDEPTELAMVAAVFVVSVAAAAMFRARRE